MKGFQSWGIALFRVFILAADVVDILLSSKPNLNSHHSSRYFISHRKKALNSGGTKVMSHVDTSSSARWYGFLSPHRQSLADGEYAARGDSSAIKHCLDQSSQASYGI